MDGTGYKGECKLTKGAGWMDLVTRGGGEYDAAYPLNTMLHILQTKIAAHWRAN